MGRRTEPIRNMNELARLLSYLEETDYTIYILACIMLYTAFRVGDVLRLSVAQVKCDVLVIAESKTLYMARNHKKDVKEGRKRPRKAKPPREVDIHPDLKKLLKKYISGKFNSDLLFPSPRDKNRHLSYSQVERRLQKAGEAVGIEGLSTHVLRKTSIYIVYQRNNDLVEAQIYAGHENPKETSIYLILDKDMRRRSILNFPTLTNLRG